LFVEISMWCGLWGGVFAAVEHSRVEVVRVLVNHGVMVDRRDK
jgi:hypothetical protein